MANIKLIRLVTGEVLVGEFHETGQKNSFVLSKPLLLGLAPGTNGQLTVNMMPYMPFSKDESYSFDMQHVMHVFDPNKQLADEFVRLTAKVFVPNKPQLIV